MEDVRKTALIGGVDSAACAGSALFATACGDVAWGILFLGLSGVALILAWAGFRLRRRGPAVEGPKLPEAQRWTDRCGSGSRRL